MIGFLQGTVLSKNLENHSCVVLTAGVGYELTVTAPFFDKLGLDSSAAFWVHTHVREDALLLYGFATEAEKQFFRVLLGVSGLGPRTALSLLAEHGPERLSRYIQGKEIDGISTAAGVGKKLAQRLVLELGGKLEKLAWAAQLEKVSLEIKETAASPKKRLREDLSSALTNLGYAPNPIKLVLDRILERAEGGGQGFEGCLKAALNELSGRPGVVASGSGSEVNTDA
jgi:Holliday junction DNA helicase RuvA